MTIAAELDSVRDDPLYSQGMAHLQAGNWPEAIRCFEAIAPRYPDDRAVQMALEEARFKARVDATARVRPRRSFIRWRPLLVRLAILVFAGAAVYLGVQVVKNQLIPGIAAAREARELDDLYTTSEGLVSVEKFDEAEENLTLYIEKRPQDEQATALMAEIKAGRIRLATYEEGQRLYKIGDLQGALDKFTTVVIQSPSYRDTASLIQQIRDEMSQEGLYTQAGRAVADGNCAEALPLLKRLETWNSNYQSVQVQAWLTQCYISEAQRLIYLEPADVTVLPQAQSYLQEALARQPTNDTALEEIRTLRQFLDGKRSFDEGRLEAALAPMRAVFNDQPDYQGGIVRTMLYEIYWRSGDQQRDQGDCSLAYERYRQACEDLGVADNVLACERQQSAAVCLTPTPTPTPTPTSTPTATPTPTPGPSPKPTEPPPLSAFRNQIVFKSDNPDQPGFWVMNPDGTNRRYLGKSSSTRNLQAEYDALIEADMWDPAHRCHTYAEERGDEDYVQVYVQCEPDPGGVQDIFPTWKVSNGLAGVSYDPVWSPDGSRIAFVSQANGSDDIWVSDPLGTDLWNFTDNDWEWDKHPSFSPDSQRIVFWSNREGTPQIYVVYTNDLRNVRKISNTTWAEYDPIWIK